MRWVLTVHSRPPGSTFVERLRPRFGPPGIAGLKEGSSGRKKGSVDSAVRARGLLASVPKGALIDGAWRQARGGETFAVTDPATDSRLADVANCGPADALDALSAASTAQATWAHSAPRLRADLLRRAYESLLDRIEDFALLITLEMGKPLAESRSELAYAADFLRWYSEEAVRIRGDFRVSPDAASRLATLRQPVGPSLLISPWNFPLAMITRKVGPAMAAGCTVIIKPAEDTPLSCLLLGDVLTEVGVPPGVVNIIPTRTPTDVVEPLMADSRLRKLSFTGSTSVGRRLFASASQNLLRTSLELGGNAPFLVFEDADLDAAIDGVMLAKMRNGGESCVAANRILVQDTIADEFVERLGERMQKVRVGLGTDPSSELGPLINPRQRTRVAELVDAAVREGARVVTGGALLAGPGAFYEPTVLTDIPSSARIRHEEIFGPVAAVYRFMDEPEAVREANATPFGLVGYLFSRDSARTLRVAEAMDVGMVGINRGLVSNAAAPFGGVKQSGLGREGGFEGIEEYVSVKYLALDVPAADQHASSGSRR